MANKHFCIDVHHHYMPDAADKLKSSAKVGSKMPPGALPWTPEYNLKCMNELGVNVSILSLSGVTPGAVGDENRRITRQINETLAGLRKAHPVRFGFFAAIPFLDDVEGVLEELKYAFDELEADGVAVSSSYGLGSSAKYVGDDLYDPIWAELDRREAVVFLHGTQTPSTTPYPHPTLGLPITEVPNETYKAAAHLVVSGRKRKYPRVKIILAHLGGSAVFLAPRAAVLSSHMGCTLTPEEALEDYKSFYFDTALSAYRSNLLAVGEFAGVDRIIFGSDTPPAPPEVVKWYNRNLEEFYDKETFDKILHENALKLFPRLKGLLTKS